MATFYSFLLVALFRLAKYTPTFIIFLSHGIDVGEKSRFQTAWAMGVGRLMELA